MVHTFCVSHSHIIHPYTYFMGGFKGKFHRYPPTTIRYLRIPQPGQIGRKRAITLF
ncbi:MAG: hypothetical protein LBS25_00600 [Candidatus Symbiothrix sp.]|jgi:hypothetical protein|nr:hypothetical protein [Candidatus Symbiothrix sp.]